MSTESPKKKVAKKPAAKKVVRRSTKKQTHTLSTISNSLSLAALSPYRFPMDIERLAVQSARIGGFAFVFLGMLFTYNYIESAVTDIAVETAHVASVSAAVPCVECAAKSQTPPVSFSYTRENADTIITVNVADAEAVTVYAFEVANGTYYRLGAAQRTNDTTWQYKWNTASASGDYWIKAVIQNGYGVYDRSDSRYLSLQ